jgi:hypothetical protein
MRKNAVLGSSLNCRDLKVSGKYDAAMGILLLVVGLFIIMGGIQMIGLGVFAVMIISVFVLSSMAIGKAVFRL